MTTARAIADALEDHFVDPKDPTSGVVLREVQAPGSPRRIDVLAVSLWASRGYGVDAVEIKVDARDFQAEIATPAKADPWWRHSNRFWIAAPSTLIANPNVLPPGWGLLVPGNGRRFKIVVKAADRPLDMSMSLFATVVGRAVNAADQRMRNGIAQAKEDHYRAQSQLEKKLRDELAAAVDPEVRHKLHFIRAVEAAAGLTVDRWGLGSKTCTEAELGAAVRLALDSLRGEHDLTGKIGRLVDEMRATAERIQREARELETRHAPAQA